MLLQARKRVLKCFLLVGPEDLARFDVHLAGILDAEPNPVDAAFIQILNADARDWVC